jgi:GTPase
VAEDTGGTSARALDSLKLKADPERIIAARTRTLVIGPYRLRQRGSEATTTSRSPEARLEEAVGLAAAIDLTLVGQLIASTDAPRPATYLGKGKVEEVQKLVEREEIGLVVVDAALTPVQQRNLEKAWETKVIDRTGLILEIFGRRARTKEGRLQVELAHLNYQKSRLVRSWTHLERQRGGFGFMGGPGETQIETDRRLIQDRMARLEKDLEQVRRTRGLHRAGRERVPYPTVALVGYTNAGKSTLFNRLTRAEVLAKDMLFATLDPTTRVIKLRSGLQVVLTDTVGFISDLPTQLIAAFRATLEDVELADVILHVRDMAHEDAEAQGEDVEAILTDLGIVTDAGARLIEVWNKSDQFDAGRREALLEAAQTRSGSQQPALVSALTGAGMDRLMTIIEARLATGRIIYHVTVAAADGEGLSWLYGLGEVLNRSTNAQGDSHIELRVATPKSALLLRRFPEASAVDAATGQ